MHAISISGPANANTMIPVVVFTLPLLFASIDKQNRRIFARLLAFPIDFL